METIQSLEAKLADLHKKQEAVLALGGENLTEAQRAEFDGFQAEYEAAEAKLATLKADEQRRLAIQNRQRQQVKPVQAQPGQARIEVKGPAADADPNRGFKTPREFLSSVMTATTTGRLDERLKPLKQATAGSDEHGEYSDAYGGYALPEGFMPNLKMLQAESDPTAGRTTRVPMSSTSVKINARTDKNHTSSVSGGLRVYRRAETEDVASSRFVMEQVKLEAHMLMGVAIATEELLADSPISFVSIIEAGMRDEFGAAILKEKLRGTGAGEYEGVIGAPCTVTVNKEGGQSADTILYKNVVKMRSRCWRYDQAVWLVNHDTLPQLMNMPDDFGRFIWQTSARDGEPSLLLGRPVFTTEFASTVGDLGDIILGVWSEYLEGELEGQKSAESMHVRFLNHERAFKFWTRNDGRCWWKSALTPAKSADTLSPFVILQAR